MHVITKIERPEISWLAQRGSLFAWKLVDTVHADAVAAGSLRIGTFASYAELEGSRGDQFDGAIDVAARSLHFGVPEHERAMDRLGFRAGMILGSRFVYRPPQCYVFCMSEVGCTHVPEPPKPRTMFEVADLVGLANLLVATNPEHLAGPWGIDRVRYKRIHYDALEAFPDPDPFVKDTEYSVEQEIRVLFVPREGQGREGFTTLRNEAVAPFLTSRVYASDRWSET